MKKNLVVIGIVVVGALLLLTFFLLSGDDSRTRKSRKGDSVVTSDRDPTISSDGGNMQLVRDDPQEALERYRRWAQYPPSSRPLHAGQYDLLNPYDAGRPAIGVISEKAEGCEKTETGMKCAKEPKFSSVRCKLTPESAISVGKPDFKVYLYCFNSTDPKQLKLPIKDIKAKVYLKLDRKLIGSPPPIGYGDDGNNGDVKKGDNLYTFLVRPSAKDWGPLYLETEFTVDGHPHVQRADWFSTPRVVGRFRTGTRDALRGGHLAVTVPVQILKEGYYKFDANLQQKEGDKEYVASASFEGRLQVGAQTVDLVFWGKIIKDRNLSGPYVVRNIRGRRDNSPVTPDMLKRSLESGQPLGEVHHTEPLYEYMAPGADHDTAMYQASDFSDKEWDSPEKQRRATFLQSLIKK